MEQQKRSRRGLRIALVVFAVVLVAALGIGWAAYARVLQLPDVLQERVELLPDLNAREGTPNAAENGTSPDAESFRIVMNQQPSVASGSNSCSLMAENPAENHYDMRVSLYLKETGQLLGTTHRIERGKRVEMLKLDPVPPPGEHMVLAQLELFDDQLNCVSVLEVELNLVVQEG